VAHRDFKDRLYPQFARIGQALASDKRLEVLDLLAQAPRHVEALAKETEMSVANVSQHLQVLRAARLVETVREGNRVRYRLADDSVLRLWLSLRGVAEGRLAEIKEAGRMASPERNGLLARNQLEDMIRKGNVLVLDVRPALEYDHGHLPGAVSIPIDELPSRLDELPRDRRITTYCRGAYCLFADEAAELLRSQGFDVVRLEGGWPEWLSEGRPVELGG
jgi:rhodanese-related sulfurtransferase